MKRYFTILFMILVFVVNPLYAQDTVPPNVSIKEIVDHWKFNKVGSEEWLDASVPGCVHTDLIKNGKIEDPFYRLNEHKVQWIDKEDWIYKTTFNLTHDWLSKDRIVLDFKGLDTHADIYLNGVKILVADNMFRAWTIDVKEWLKLENNELKIYFHSPIKVGLKKYDNYPHIVHSSANDLAEIGQVPGNKWLSPHLRKAQCHFGWDWGPRLVTSGIWQPVFLKAWNNARIVDLRIVQNEITREKASLTAEFEIDAEVDVDVKLQLKVNHKQVISLPIRVKKDTKNYTIDFEIEKPKLWWCNGLGDAYMYKIGGSLVTKDEFDEVVHNIGLRTVDLIREKDREGKSFFVKLNGFPVFMKGANYIPADAFLDRVNPKKYEKIILAAKECNFNMLRVWGGGIYEKDIFYDLCDKHGILVWQDFMFACNMYPGHPEFLESVRQEAVYNIKRLRNHPSVALWCGNNEVLAAWKSWGWEMKEKKRDPIGAQAQWKAYKDIFLNILPNEVKRLDPQRFYHPSSPQAGDSLLKVPSKGDRHYWGVWWGKDKFSKYHTEVSRFMSEYGFQSFPEMQTINQYTNPEDHNIYSEVMKSHQRSSIGNKTIEMYMLRDYRKPKNFESFIYAGQVLQAEGMKQGMEGHRIAKPYNMGSLFWQINDCWPVASWSSTDYYVNWKAMQYFSKKAFAQVLVAPRIEKRKLEVYIVSDRLTAFEGEMKLNLLDFNGNTLWSESKGINVGANSSKSFFSQSFKKWLKKFDRSQIVLQLVVQEKGETITSNNFYFVPVKELNLPKPDIKNKYQKGRGRIYY